MDTYFNLYYEDPVFQTFEGSPITSQIDGRYCMGVFAGKDMISGNTLRVSVSPVDYSYESDTLSSKVHYDVHLLSISEDYYRYMKIMRGYSITIGDANFGALIEPADTYSNVENGFGIVTGYQEDKSRITERYGTSFLESLGRIQCTVGSGLRRKRPFSDRGILGNLVL